MINLIIVLAIVASIVIGYKTKINTGLVAIIFAYLIGCLGLGLAPKDIIGMWPTSTMFQIMTITLFYGIGNINGTLEKTARYLLYYMRNYKKLLPFILFLIAVLIGALGAGNFAVVAFLAPLSRQTCSVLASSSTLIIVPLMLISPRTAIELSAGLFKAMEHSAIRVEIASLSVIPIPCRS